MQTEMRVDADQAISKSTVPLKVLFRPNFIFLNPLFTPNYHLLINIFIEMVEKRTCFPLYTTLPPMIIHASCIQFSPFFHGVDGLFFFFFLCGHHMQWQNYDFPGNLKGLRTVII